MEEHVRRIRQASSIGKQNFLNSPLHQAAVMHNLSQLGIWAKQLRQGDCPEIPLQELTAFRNHIIHNTSQITPEILWHNTQQVLRSYRRHGWHRDGSFRLISPRQSSQKRPPDELKTHIQRRMQAIAGYLNTIQNIKGFERDPVLQDAVAHNLAVIGELCNHLKPSEGEEIQEALSTLIRIRNQIAHPEKHRQAREANWLWHQLLDRVGAAAGALNAYFAAPVQQAG
jgi:uncharacterized protein with HEPN domain